MKHPPSKLLPNFLMEVKEPERRNYDSSAVFQIPGTSWFFDSKVLEY
jgi:hypothetical protein